MFVFVWVSLLNPVLIGWVGREWLLSAAIILSVMVFAVLVYGSLRIVTPCASTVLWFDTR